MRRTCKWLGTWTLGSLCAFGLGDCGDAIGSFFVDIIATLMGKTP